MTELTSGPPYACPFLINITVRGFKLPLEGVATALDLAYSRQASRLSFECWEVCQLTRIRALSEEYKKV